MSDDFLAWIPNNIKSSRITVPPEDTPMNGTFAANNITLQSIFQRIAIIALLKTVCNEKEDHDQEHQYLAMATPSTIVKLKTRSRFIIGIIKYMWYSSNIDNSRDNFGDNCNNRCVKNRTTNKQKNNKKNKKQASSDHDNTNSYKCMKTILSYNYRYHSHRKIKFYKIVQTLPI